MSFQVNAVVLAAIDKAKLLDGLESEAQSVAADPAHEPQIGAPPLAEVRQSVPAPPVAVAPKAPVLFLT